MAAKQWVAAKARTLPGWLVTVPAGLAIKSTSGETVGYTGYAKWLRVKTKGEAVRAAKHLNDCKIASLKNAYEAVQLDLLVSVLGSWE